jgi:hypothetical protein
MTQIRITYRSEIILNAETKEEAQAIFEDLNLDNLEKEHEDGKILTSDFVELVEITEQ